MSNYTDEELAEFLSKLSADEKAALFAQIPLEQKEVLMPGGKATLGKDGVQKQDNGKMITPDTGFVLKTKNVKTQQKVFINICYHNDIDKPGVKKKLDANGQEVEGYNVPMSVGPGKDCPDKAGVPSVAYDMIVNPIIVNEIKEDTTGKQRDFICQLAIQCIENKYKIELDKRYKLPNAAYIGEVTSQWIKDVKAMPKIEEVSEPKKKAATKAAQSKIVEVAEPDKEMPQMEVVWIPFNNTVLCDHASYPRPSTIYQEPIHVSPQDIEGAKIIFKPLTVKLEGGVEVKDIVKVQTSPYRLQISIRGYRSVNVFFPCAIQPLSVRSFLSRVEGHTNRVVQLVVTVALEKRFDEIRNGKLLSVWDSLSAGDPGSRAWLMANALDSSAEQSSNCYRFTEPCAKQVSESLFKGGQQDFVVHASPRTLQPDTPDDDEEDLPEDVFHKKDAASQYIISQREQGVKEKWDKHEKEKKARANDANVEYIDTEDLKPGGKYGPKISDSPSISVASTEAAGGGLHGLSSTLWGELL